MTRSATESTSKSVDLDLVVINEGCDAIVTPTYRELEEVPFEEFDPFGGVISLDASFGCPAYASPEHRITSYLLKESITAWKRRVWRHAVGRMAIAVEFSVRYD